jgi:hypothetical protein
VDEEQVQVVEAEGVEGAVESGECGIPRVESVVTKISERSMPDAATASPTCFSLPYISAVSMWRYPTSRASRVACFASSGVIWYVPNPSCGMSTPLFRVMVGTWVIVCIS